MPASSQIASSPPARSRRVNRYRHYTRAPGRPNVTVVIPAKNEERNITWVLQLIPAMVDEMILVDGLSVDRTMEVARLIRPDVRVVEEKQPGKGALRAGFRAVAEGIQVRLSVFSSSFEAAYRRRTPSSATNSG
ncbi:MAG: glycosyltransferase [Candidatus Limnocylindria bacterium]